MHLFRTITVILLGAAVLLAPQWCACAHAGLDPHTRPDEPSLSACGHACHHHEQAPAPSDHEHEHDCCCDGSDRPMLPGEGGVRFVRSADWTVAASHAALLCPTRPSEPFGPWPRGLCLSHSPPRTPVALRVLLTI
ncbi:MAG: hypothetical protein KF699_13780 [Phycisphaeraceae bacterium]|nr:hypothetical protein [Phycisphaeraceae bacterium]